MDIQLLEHRREWRAEEGRIGSVERELAILQTKFEGALERAVSGDDLKQLRREVDDQMKQTTHNIRDYFDIKTEQQSQAILGQVEVMMSRRDDRLAEEQRTMRRQIFLAVLGSGLSIIAALIVFRLTSS